MEVTPLIELSGINGGDPVMEPRLQTWNVSGRYARVWWAEAEAAAEAHGDEDVKSYVDVARVLEGAETAARGAYAEIDPANPPLLEAYVMNVVSLVKEDLRYCGVEVLGS